MSDPLSDPGSATAERGGITPRLRDRFGQDGFLMVPGALGEPLRARLEAAVDRVYREEAAARRLRPDGSLHLLSFIGRDKAFLDLLDLPTTFPLVWGLLGWNIHAYHSHLDVNPPTSTGQRAWRWHQDGGRQNLETETAPRPLLSVKVAYVLSDLGETGRGATRIIPGSHVRNRLPQPERPELSFEEPDGAVEVIAAPGDAFLFDRRLWHSPSRNLSLVTRKMLFVGYTYRWIRQRDEPALTPGHPLWPAGSPVRRQLLGEGADAQSYWGLGDGPQPLRDQLAAAGLLDDSVAVQR